jgi:hypothetical protein
MVTPGIDLGCNEVEVLTGWGVSTTAAVDVGESSLAGWSGGGERRWLGHGAAVSWGRGPGSSCWVGDGLRWATHGEVELGDGGGGRCSWAAVFVDSSAQRWHNAEHNGEQRHWSGMCAS